MITVVARRSFQDMKAWVPWVLPVGLLITVALAALLPGLSGVVFLLVWGWLLFPASVIYVRSRSRSSGPGDRASEDDVDYWRTKLL